MAGTFSRTLLTLDGSTEQKIAQLRSQLQLVQEETEDMIRDLKKANEALAAKIAQLEKEE